MTEVRFLVLTPDGELSENVAPDAGRGLLDTLYRTINCDHVEAVRLGRDGLDATMYVDGDGMLVQLPMPNEYATAAVYGFNGDIYQMYYGTAVFLGGVNRAGDDTSITPKAEIYLRHLMWAIKTGRLRLPGNRGRQS
ncbi:DUF3846 domain-containing protein [Amycolatopsis anabasis]|uniref:DUF3846 domain-containing protein n=1 Tax=Amycolatopsis anabasis TaxID=1840409 RepID=UPI00131AC3FC|nr:DUF3846 domain-containing protein [Amycolatopsis anabasis]